MAILGQAWREVVGQRQVSWYKNGREVQRVIDLLSCGHQELRGTDARWQNPTKRQCKKCGARELRSGFPSFSEDLGQ